MDIGEAGTAVRHKLAEIQRGLFIADDGETVDFRGSIPTWRNIELVRVSGGPSVWQWAFLAFAGLLACAWLVGSAVRGVGLRRRSRLAIDREPIGPRRWRRLGSAVATLTAILTLATIAVLAAMPGLVDSGFIGWLELPLAQRLLLHLPFALAVVGGCLVALGAVGWVRAWWSGQLRVQHATLTAATALFLAQLTAWRLIGWGFA